jgi:hypothetical protein
MDEAERFDKPHLSNPLMDETEEEPAGFFDSGLV